MYKRSIFISHQDCGDLSCYVIPHFAEIVDHARFGRVGEIMMKALSLAKPHGTFLLSRITQRDHQVGVHFPELFHRL